MKAYFVELSKYMIVILIALYTFESFLVFRMKMEKHTQGVFFRQKIYFFMLQLVAFITLYMKSGNTEYLIFYGFVQIFLLTALTLTKMIYEKINSLLLNHMCMLLGISFIILSRLSMQKVFRQLAIAVISYVIAMFIPLILNKFKFWSKLTWVYAGVGIVILLLVQILGNLTHGSKITFTLAGLTFQPSEFVKLLFIFFLAASLYKDTSFKNVARTTVIAAAYVIILVGSRDLGSGLIFFIAYLLVVFMASNRFYYLYLGIGGGMAGSVAAYYLFDHVRVRVLAWQNPFAYIDNQGYQISQSLFAIGSGSWFGLGLLSGSPKDIPFVETDFIFSAICEEMGVIFGICILLICICCFISMMNHGLKSRDIFYKLISFGLAVIYIFQIFLTIGGGIKFIPLTGVTLPLISYGGSSVMSTIFLFFLIQSISVKCQKEGATRNVFKEESTGRDYKTIRRIKKEEE
ncbi:MAG TPA: FtsW/RodA/SpoVE family cell cycle protein [Lachnospiraceae bacterium]|nr:FtsW/RodA/SpoVE family cell cycle protein [Lachnospiraceae bacterium]